MTHGRVSGSGADCRRVNCVGEHPQTTLESLFLDALKKMKRGMDIMTDVAAAAALSGASRTGRVFPETRECDWREHVTEAIRQKVFIFLLVIGLVVHRLAMFFTQYSLGDKSK